MSTSRIYLQRFSENPGAVDSSIQLRQWLIEPTVLQFRQKLNRYERARNRHVCFTPKSGYWNSVAQCPLCATSGLMQCSKFALGQKRGHFITPRQCPLFPRKRTSSRPRRGKVSNLLRAYLQAIKRVQSGTKGADSKPKLALLCVPNA